MMGVGSWFLGFLRAEDEGAGDRIKGNRFEVELLSSALGRSSMRVNDNPAISPVAGE
jgi:hypothetical protein